MKSKTNKIKFTKKLFGNDWIWTNNLSHAKRIHYHLCYIPKFVQLKFNMLPVIQYFIYFNFISINLIIIYVCCTNINFKGSLITYKYKPYKTKNLKLWFCNNRQLLQNYFSKFAQSIHSSQFITRTTIGINPWPAPQISLHWP